MLFSELSKHNHTDLLRINQILSLLKKCKTRKPGYIQSTPEEELGLSCFCHSCRAWALPTVPPSDWVLTRPCFCAFPALTLCPRCGSLGVRFGLESALWRPGSGEARAWLCLCSIRTHTTPSSRIGSWCWAAKNWNDKYLLPIYFDFTKRIWQESVLITFPALEVTTRFFASDLLRE